MGNTVLGLFGVCLAAALSELLLPGDEGRGTKATLRVLVSLAVVLLLVRPVLPYLRQSSDFSFESLVGESEDPTAEYEEIFEHAVSVGSEQELRQGLQRVLQNEYGIEENDVYIKIHFDRAGELSRVEIYLSGRAQSADLNAIRTDISARLQCETEVR